MQLNMVWGMDDGIVVNVLICCHGDTRKMHVRSIAQ